MEIIYTLEPADFVAYRKYAARNGSWTDRAVIPFTILFSFGTVAFVVGTRVAARLAKHQPVDWMPMGMTLAASISLALLMLPLLRWQAQREYAKNPLLRLPQTLRLETTRLVWQHQQTCTTTLWTGVQDVDADECALYFILDQNGVYIVPRRVFVNPEVADEFFAAATRYWKDEAIIKPKSSEIWPPPPRIGA